MSPAARFSEDVNIAVLKGFASRQRGKIVDTEGTL